nr:lipid A deacylase LpxR family protein [Kushneria aurantia]
MASFKLSNDFFSARDSDGHYTNGAEFSWAFTPGDNHWTRRLADGLPGWSPQSVDAVAYRFGQQIYTPEDIEESALIEDDRPWAGYLYAGLSLYGNDLSPEWRINDALSLDVGMVGPASGGELVQENFHHLIGSREPEGWHNQLNNEPTATLAWQRSWWYRDRLGGLALEYGPNTGLALGNLHDHVSLGAAVRLGPRLDNQFATPGIAPNTSGNPLFSRDGGFNWSLLAQFQGRFVARNLFLDGNTFESSHSVDRRQWVGDLQLGGNINRDRFSLRLVTVTRTRQFEQQDGNDYFGTLIFSSWL